MKRIVVTVTFLLAFVGGAALAESTNQQAADKKDVVQNKKELEASRKCLDRLISLVDRWHEANLDGNEKNIRQYEHAIINTLIKDINASFQWVDRAEHERARHRVQVRVDDESDLAQARVLLACKEAILHKLQKSDYFSVRYRLLSDYQDLLRRELKMSRVELAENVKDVRKEGK